MKKVLTKFMACAFALFVVSCGDVQDSDSGQGGGNGQQGGGGSGGTVINIPESYGESVLPDLTSASAFSGQSYLRYDKEDILDDEDEAFFFNKDGTCIIKDIMGSAGSSDGKLSYSFRQLQNTAYVSYSYNPSTQKLLLKLKAYCLGNKKFTDAESAVEAQLQLLKIDALASGCTSISIPQEWLDASKKSYARKLAGYQVEYDCSVMDGKLVLDNPKKDEGEYKYSNGDIRFKLYLNDYDISVENGKYELENPVIYTMENGKFTGADFKWVIEDSAVVLKKLGEFEGTYEIEYGSCYAKLTSVTGDIPYTIKNMVGTDYELLPNVSKSTKQEFKPILKTVNYTVIGSDDVVATDSAQFYISDSSVTTWTDTTFKFLTSDYITGIYTNQDCTRSVMGKEILDGARVYMKLKNITAVSYNAQVDNLVENAGKEVSLTVQKKCTVTFNLNDGSGNTYVQEFTSGIPFEVSRYDIWNNSFPDKDGKKYFAGWSTDRNATEALYDSNGNYYEKYMFTEDTVLYAVWKDVLTLIIKDPDGVLEDCIMKNTDGDYDVSEGFHLGGDYIGHNLWKNGYNIIGFSKDKNSEKCDYRYEQNIFESAFGNSTQITLYVVYLENSKPVPSSEVTYTTFGTFPQSLKASAVTINESITKMQGAYTYYKGSDGAWYAKFENSYYKVEPIKWHVLTDDYNGTGKKLLLAENILISCAYYDYRDVTRNIKGNMVYSSDYEHSKVRAYLNGLSYRIKENSSAIETSSEIFMNKGFLQTAFTSEEQKLIAQSSVVSKKYWSRDANSTIIEKIPDKIFLFNEEEGKINGYNFDENNIKRVPSDFAVSLGAGEVWWLRDFDDYYKSYARRISSYDGPSGSSHSYVDCSTIGVVPALCLN